MARSLSGGPPLAAIAVSYNQPTNLTPTRPPPFKVSLATARPSTPEPTNPHALACKYAAPGRRTITDEQLVHMKQFEVSMASSVVHAESCKLLSNSHPGEGQPCRSGEALEMLFSVRDQYGNPILHSEEACAMQRA